MSPRPCLCGYVKRGCSDAYFAVMQAALFGFEAHDVAFDRDVDGARQIAVDVVAHGIDKVAYQAQVASAVAVPYIAFDLFYPGVPYTLFAASEIGYRESAHVAHDFTSCSHNLGSSSSFGHESFHREIGCYSVFKLHARHIVVALVVVHLEYASSVVGRAQYLSNGIVLQAAFLGQIEGIDMFPFLDVYV